MQAVSLAARAAPHREIVARRCRSTEVDLCWIAVQLGLAHRPRRAIIEKLRLLVEQSGFPTPKNPRFVKGVRQHGASSIHAHSLWDRDAVERWLEDDRPPAESAAIGVIRRTAVADEMGRRAASLVLVA